MLNYLAFDSMRNSVDMFSQDIIRKKNNSLKIALRTNLKMHNIPKTPEVINNRVRRNLFLQIVGKSHL